FESQRPLWPRSSAVFGYPASEVPRPDPVLLAALRTARTLIGSSRRLAPASAKCHAKDEKGKRSNCDAAPDAYQQTDHQTGKGDGYGDGRILARRSVSARAEAVDKAPLG